MLPQEIPSQPGQIWQSSVVHFVVLLIHGQNLAPSHYFTLFQGRIAAPVPLSRWRDPEEVVQDFGLSTCFTFLTVVAPMFWRTRAARKRCAKWCRILSINSIIMGSGPFVVWYWDIPGVYL